MLKPRLRQQLAELTAIPSISCTRTEQDMSNLPVINTLATWFEAAGFACEIMPVAKGKANLIAVRAGSDPTATGGLILSGHTDTVPCDPQLWHSDPFKLIEKGNKLYGLGIADMKGFFALILEAASSFARTPFKSPLIVVATCDEETSMAGAKALMAAGKTKGRFCLIGEPTSMKPIRMHKGVMLERVVITGQAGHSSDPSLGHNAIDAMYDVLTRLRQFRDQLKKISNPNFPVPNPTMNFGCIHGGDNPNRICGLCELQFDIRTVPGMKQEALRQEIRELLADIGQKHGVQLVYESASDGSPSAETPADSPFVQKMRALTGEVAGSVSFGTEAPYFCQQGIDTIILGPGNIEQAHQPDEYLDANNISPMILLLNQLIHYYCVQGHARF